MKIFTFNLQFLIVPPIIVFRYVNRTKHVIKFNNWLVTNHSSNKAFCNRTLDTSDLQNRGMAKWYRISEGVLK